MKIKKYLRSIIDPYSKISFILKIKKNSKILDIGCGNNSVKLIKSIVSNVNYTGIDISDYNLDEQAKKQINKYILSSPNMFHEEIKNHGEYDYIISSHNLEHCNDWKKTAESMCKATAKKGMLFISTPSVKSLTFPSRAGTLNFYDDETHNIPVNITELKDIIKANGMEIIYFKDGHSTKLTRLIGMIQEMKSIRNNRVLSFTWAYWGFESIIWAVKK